MQDWIKQGIATLIKRDGKYKLKKGSIELPLTDKQALELQGKKKRSSGKI